MGRLHRLCGVWMLALVCAAVAATATAADRRDLRPPLAAFAMEGHVTALLPVDDGFYVAQPSKILYYRYGALDATMDDARLRVPQSMAMRDGVLFVADGDRLLSFDRADGHRFLGEIPMQKDKAKGYKGIAIGGATLYLSTANPSGVYRADIQDVRHPKAMTRWRKGQEADALLAKDDALYAVATGKVAAQYMHILYRIAGEKKPKAEVAATIPFRFVCPVISPTGRYVYATDQAVGSIVAIDVETGAETTVYQEAGTAPVVLAVDEALVYIHRPTRGQLLVVESLPETDAARVAVK